MCTGDGNTELGASGGCPGNCDILAGSAQDDAFTTSLLKVKLTTVRHHRGATTQTKAVGDEVFTHRSTLSSSTSPFQTQQQQTINYNAHYKHGVVRVFF